MKVWLVTLLASGCLWGLVTPPLATAISEPTPEREPWDALSGTDSASIKRATASGSMQLPLPEQELMAIADLPETKLTCERPTYWWLALVFQVAATGAYLLIFKPSQLTTGWLWLTAISVVAYMVYAMIGCSCTGQQACNLYLFINLGILAGSGGWFYWRERK